MQKALSDLEKLAKLPDNWGGDGEKKPRKEVVAAAENFLFNVLRDDDPVPDLRPTHAGSVQMEWHCSAASLEIEFETPSDLGFIKWIHGEGTRGEPDNVIADNLVKVDPKKGLPSSTD